MNMVHVMWRGRNWRRRRRIGHSLDSIRRRQFGRRGNRWRRRGDVLRFHNIGPHNGDKRCGSRAEQGNLQSIHGRYSLADIVGRQNGFHTRLQRGWGRHRDTGECAAAVELRGEL